MTPSSDEHMRELARIDAEMFSEMRQERDDLREVLRQAVRIIARSENKLRSREGQDFLANARKALGT